MRVSSDLDVLTEIAGCPMLEESNAESIKQYRRFVIQVPKDSALTLDEFKTALDNIVAGDGI